MPAGGEEPEVPAGKGEVSPSGKFTPSPPEADAKDAGSPAGEKEPERKTLGEHLVGIGDVTVDTSRRCVSLTAKANQREGVVEYVLVQEKGKVHESLLTTKASPRDLHAALLLIGLKPGPETALDIRVEWQGNGPRQNLPLEELVQLGEDPGKDGDGGDSGTTPAATMPSTRWIFNGSSFTRQGYAADSEGSFISLITDLAATINNPNASRQDDTRHHVRRSVMPPAGVSVTVVFRAAAKQP